MTASLRRDINVSIGQFLHVSSFVCDTASVVEGSALVASVANDQAVALPAAGEALGFVGLALFAGSTSTGQTLQLVVGGYYLAVASGAVTRGDYLVIADSTGKLKTWNSSINGGAIVAQAMESVTTGQRVYVKVFNSVPAQSLVTPFVAGTGGTTINCACVVGAADSAVILPSGADPTSGVVGIALNTVSAAGIAYVVTSGLASVKATSAGFTRGDNLAIGAAAGTLKLAAPSTGVNTMLVGTALGTAGANAVAAALIHPCLMQGA